MGIRNAARTLVVEDGKVLMSKYNLEGQLVYTLPGGGQKKMETMEQAACRECLEETGYEVRVRRLAALFEEIRKDAPEDDPYAHKIHYIFLCELEDNVHRIAPHRDASQVGEEWISVERLGEYPILPKILKEELPVILRSKKLLYFGASFE